MKASKKLITFYKAWILEPIVNKVNLDGVDVSKEQMDTYLKSLVDLDKSCIEMSTEELQLVIEQGIILGKEYGLNLDYPQDELDVDISFAW
jgi:uncharacterized membrane protein YheB (UPF0754 family)